MTGGGPDDLGSDGGSSPETRYEAFLRGERPDDVLVYLHEDSVGSMAALARVGTRVDDGVVLVVPGEEGREALREVTGIDAMDFARRAMETDGRIDRDCAGGTCPEADDADPDGGGGSAGDSSTDGAHYPTVIFAFAEPRNEAVGGLYAEGDVVHGYAACNCGTAYSEKWTAE